MFDEGGNVINRIVFLNECLGVFEVPPQTLLKIGEDALEIVIGNEVGEKHKEEEEKFDGHIMIHLPYQPRRFLPICSAL